MLVGIVIGRRRDQPRALRAEVIETMAELFCRRWCADHWPSREWPVRSPPAYKPRCFSPAKPADPIASAAGIIGAEVFTGKTLRGRVLPMNKKAWALKFKKYAVLAGVNEPKKSCHGVRKARAEVTAYADCTESQMMAMFGWTDPKMPAHYIAQANREKLGISGIGEDRGVRSEPVPK